MIKDLEKLAVKREDNPFHSEVLKVIRQISSEFRNLGYTLPVEMAKDLARFYQDWYDKTKYLELHSVSIKFPDTEDSLIAITVKADQKGCLLKGGYRIKDIIRGEVEDE